MGAIVLFMFSAMLGLLSYSVVSGQATTSETQAKIGKNVFSTTQQVASDELLRAELTAAIYSTPTGSTITFLQTMNCYFNPSQSCPKPTLNVAQSQLVTASPIKGLPAKSYLSRQLIDVSASGAVNQFADFQVVNSDPSLPSPKTKTVRLSLGQAVLFNNAVTMNKTDCLFCHALVYGNVAQYENVTNYPATASKIHGGYYSASDITTDPTAAVLDLTNDPVLLNVAQDPVPKDSTSSIADYVGMQPGDLYDDGQYWTSYAQRSQAFYQGPSLPWNIPRQSFSLPKFNPDSALLTVHGTIKGPPMELYPFAGVANPGSPCQGTTRSITGISECNVIINARDNGPLTINGDVFFHGDVIIFGQIQGQGAIYSGRNIYIADNLTYVKPSPLFNLTTGSNALMDTVSTNAAGLANQMAGYDELKLFATNNIVIGDPWPENQNGAPGDETVGTDLNYMFENMFTMEGQVARDPVTGYQLDPVSVNGNGAPCYIFPWGKPGQCVNNPIIEPFVIYGPTSQATDYQVWSSIQGIPLPPAYQNSFYPGNPSGTSVIPWIDFATFTAKTKNIAAWNHASSTIPGYPLRRTREKMFVFPILQKSTSGSPYDTSNWMDGATMWAAMKNYMGANVSGVQTLRRGYRASGNNGPISLDQRVVDFINSCNQAMTSWGGFSRSYGVSDMVRCVYSYNSVTQVSAEQVMPTCSDYIGQSPNICTTDNSDAPPAPLSAADFYNADFSIHLMSGQADAAAGAPGNFGRYKVISNYWDPNVVRPRNRITDVQSFMYANQFISYADDSVSDRQIRIYGGIVAKQVAARFVNHFGTDRVYNNGLQMSLANYSLDNGVSPSIIIYQDPRTQFDTELLSSDYGSTIFDY